MVLSAQPVPPMPVIVGEEVPDEITCMSGEHKVANSHDLWSMLMITAMERKNDEENVRRAEKQKEFVVRLFDDIRALRADTEMSSNDREGRVYELFSRFTRQNVSALSSSDDLRFAPLHSIAREDRIHIAACHHAAAQDILFGGLKTDSDQSDRKTAEQFSDHAFTSLMMRQYARLCETV